MALILGVETSCDETSASVVEDGRLIHSLITASQVDIHRAYGGVFPEMASRQHILAIIPVIDEALGKAGILWKDLDALAVTNGPGLAGSLLVGVNAVKGLAAGSGLPFIAVNHLEAHVCANWLVEKPATRAPGNACKPDASAADLPPEPTFPVICLIVSGGHTALVYIEEEGHYRLLGQTIDDAAGEAFDKVARLLGLGYPGGPAIEAAAAQGNPKAFDLPRAWLKESYDFSFSGLKTAVLRLVQRYGGATVPRAMRHADGSSLPPRVVRDLAIPDLAASFQEAVVDVLVEKARLAAEAFPAKEVLLAGGVAANKLLRQEMTARLGLPVRYPPIKLCTDNAAMVAGAAYFRYRQGDFAGWDLDVYPNLSLSEALHLDA